MLTFKFPVQETIDGRTLIYDGPELDPRTLDQDPNPVEGDVEDYTLWVQGDPPATHVVVDVNTGEQKIKILARRQKGVWWKYKVHVDRQKFQRRKKDDQQWGEEQDVTLLRVQRNSEPPRNVLSIIIGANDGARLEHQWNSDCTLTWNPATRRYRRTC